MTQPALEKPMVKSKEGRSPERMEQHDDIAVLHSRTAYFDSESTNRKSPASQKPVLILGNVFVENNHALRVLRREGRCFPLSASVANRTASAMASRGTVPRHCHTIVSQSIPSATCSSTCATRTRVPRNVG